MIRDRFKQFITLVFVLTANETKERKTTIISGCYCVKSMIRDFRNSTFIHMCLYLQQMKQNRVKLMKQMKEESDSFRKWKQQKNKEVLQLQQKVKHLTSLIYKLVIFMCFNSIQMLPLWMVSPIQPNPHIYIHCLRIELGTSCVHVCQDNVEIRTCIDIVHFMSSTRMWTWHIVLPLSICHSVHMSVCHNLVKFLV